MTRLVSVVLPVYNEERTMESAASETIAALESFLPEGTFEIIFAEDGSRDHTPQIAQQLAENDARINHFHSDERLGRGQAVEAAFRASDGEILVYFDSDLATDLSSLEELIESVRSEGYDVVTGSRWIQGQEAKRSAKRGIASRSFNWLVRVALPSDIRDHQCGFKAFDRKTAFKLFDFVEDNHWFWDTEALVRAQNMNYRVKEFPVEWTEKGDSKVRFSRDILDMGSGIVRMWWEYSVDPRINQRTTALIGILFIPVLVALGAQIFDPSEIIAHIGRADSSLIALAALLYVVSFPVMAVRYQTILTALGFRERLRFLTGAIFISQTGNVVFPARAGDPIRAYLVKSRSDVPYPSGFASLAIERMFDLMTVTVIAGVMLLGFVATGITSIGGIYTNISSFGSVAGETILIATIVVGIVTLIIAGLLVVSVQTNRNHVHTIGDRFGPSASVALLMKATERFITDLHQIAANPRASFQITGDSIVIWSIDVLVAVIVLVAFGVDVPFGTLIAVGFFAVSVGNLAKILPLSSGGIGMYEGAFTILVVALTPIGASTALSAAIVDHAIKNGVTLFGGIGSILTFNISFTTAVEKGREALDTATKID